MSLTVGIPFHNAKLTLADAIRSVFAQSYGDWTLLLLNDGSTDGSLAIARSVKDARVMVIDDCVNRGLAYRLNQIAELATGTYLARMDADDLMLPDRFAKQVAYLDANPTVEVVDTGMYSIDPLDRPCGARRAVELRVDLASVMRNGLMRHATIMGRREWFRRHPYDPSFRRAEDHELWCRTCRTGRFGRIQEPLYIYRESLNVDPRKFAICCRHQRFIYRRYGHGVIGLRERLALMAGSHCRALFMRALCLCRLQSHLIRRRNRPLTRDETHRVASVIGQIKTTVVPGLPPHSYGE